MNFNELIMGDLEKTDEFIKNASSVYSTGELISLAMRYDLDLNEEDAALLMYLMQPTEIK